jgi:hypothetical protein
LWSNISANGFVCEYENCDDMKMLRKKVFLAEDTKKQWLEQQGNFIADTIKNSFKSEYIITATNAKDLDDVLNASNRFEKVYSDMGDGKLLVYHIRNI